MGCSSSTTHITIAEGGPPKERDPQPVLAAVVPEENTDNVGEEPEVNEVTLPVGNDGNVESNGVIESDNIVPEWTKVVSSLTWAASQKFASDKKGRLVTLEEAQSFFKKRGASLYPGEDQWAACVRQDGSKDWIQVGDKVHHVGKSHVDEQGGYPRWGDDASGNPPYARSVMWLASSGTTGTISVSRPKPRWNKQSKSLSWRAAKDEASNAGGRLLELEEARNFLKHHGPLYPGEDQWVAVGRKDGRHGGRDWLQVGDKVHHLGKSHVDEQGGYPQWGDDSSGNPPYARTLLWIEVVSNSGSTNSTKSPVWQKESFSLTWDASKQTAARMGGRLLLLPEARAFLKKRGPLSPGNDEWVAVMRQDGSKDWIQVGDKVHHLGKSHVDEQGGYPQWGDDASGNPPFARSLLWISLGLVSIETKWVKAESFIWKKESGEICEAMWVKPGRSLTWSDSRNFADERAGRLLGLSEARSFLGQHGALFKGEDQWVAVMREDGSKDWIQVGDIVHHLGKSHVDECGAYPSWGDDASKNPPHSQSVLWLSAANFSGLGEVNEATNAA